ncbi:DUF2929 family protein [Staphylococcus massiliensis]|uniref:DUF2929 domain-containing protein n=1 Tax=Staphylococcus massiliensis S46 TaxID=1229783 RepID=K9ALA0_9STAP|nr:DUF2929 family protein [Staphylococcus massiliensis]EKU48074.1 hypothetical protein C273_06428 [Staphylococcus massiliensis S46]MCG3399988.1 YjzD family protein [Staphylococcus massiliensis]MCG3401615.1 YjzD family protein [Staphylococcus massiliensis]MCG3412149.1 YjzD family protein [Staphylococcus massiliensis]POA01217.1 DUF2929 domain-containing protein [Staphylococcus massiliensis CCUG 55927]
MRYVITFIWALLLMQMINFVLNSLAGGGSLNFFTPIVMAVIIVIVIAILDAIMKPSKRDSHAKSEVSHQR